MAAHGRSSVGAVNDWRERERVIDLHNAHDDVADSET